MALSKQSLTIDFSQGLDQKTDPYQVAPGKFLALQNSVFDKAKRLTKRNGYGSLTTLPDDTNTFVTTFNGNLTAIGTSLEAYSKASAQWINKGHIQPALVDTLPLIRNTVNQVEADTAFSANGLVCTVYVENDVVAGVIVPTLKYAVADSTTGQNIVAPTNIPAAGGTLSGGPKVFYLGNYFMLLFTNRIGGVDHLQYISINATVPTTVSTNIDISTAYTSSTTGAFDAQVVNNSLFIAWNSNTTSIKMTLIDRTLLQHNTVTFAGRVATIMSVTGDTTDVSPIIYASFYNSGDSTGYTLAVDSALGTVLAPTQTIAAETVLNITSAAQNEVNTIFYEVANNYTYDSAIPTHYIKKRTITQAGSLGSASVMIRSIGLASKAFIVNAVIYMLTCYVSVFQPTYFLIDSSANVISKIAYENGDGYLVLGLPNVTVTGTLAQAPYLIKDLIEAVNKTQGAANAAGVYSQTGINLVSFDITTSDINTAEIGNDLHVTGGILWMYDGYTPVEHMFFLYPDNVEAIASTGGGAMTPQQYFYQATYEWADNQGNVFRSAPSIPITVTPTASVNHTFTDTDVNTGTDVITVIGHGYSTGTVFTLTTSGTLPAPLVIATNYYVISTGANTIKVATSLANALAGTAINITTTGAGTDTIHVGTNQNSVTVNVPTLRLTYKVANPVKLVLYRWSTAQQIYYQVTSVLIPTLNDKTVDSIAILDTQSDASIIGNNILYTAGGVLENVAAPPVSSLTLFQSRLFYIDSEDKNLLGYSKQVIESVPVETSDLLSIYVAPTTGAQGSTGPMRCLSAMDDKLIIFKDNAIYYIAGTGPDNTGANSQYSDAIFISSTVGCANQHSIVFMPNGLMFQSDKGIWLLDRNLSTSYIGAPVDDFTLTAQVLSAVNVPGTNQVRFTLDSGITLMYDYYFGQWGTFVNVPAVSSTLYEMLHTYINSTGQVFQETPGVYLDGAKPVLMSFTTSWLNVAGLQGYERAYYFYLLGTYISPHKLSVGIAYDYNPGPSQSTLVTPDNFMKPWGGEQLWGSGGPYGGSAIEQWRIFLQQQKCQAFQISVNEIYDPTLGVAAGAGLTLSGLDVVIGTKSSYPKIKPSRSAG